MSVRKGGRDRVTSGRGGGRGSVEQDEGTSDVQHRDGQTPQTRWYGAIQSVRLKVS